MKYLLILALALPYAARAEDPNDAATGEKLCRVALSGCLEENKKAYDLMDAQDKLLEYDKEQIERLQSQNDSVLKSPWLWLTVGIITGAVVSRK